MATLTSMMDPVRPMMEKLPTQTEQNITNNNYLPNGNNEQGRDLATSYTNANNSIQGTTQNAEDLEYERSCVVYVGGLTARVEEEALCATFRRFGTVISIVRRGVDYDSRQVTAGQQYAFVKYTSPEEARAAIELGEVVVGGRKLLIKPRDRPSPSFQRVGYHGNSEFRHRHNERGRDHVHDLHSKNRGSSAGSYGVVEFGRQNKEGLSAPPGLEIPSHYQQHFRNGNSGQASGTLPMLLSKALNVANIPTDMTPKEFYTLFSEIGNVEGCYIFPYLDNLGRKFGYIVMATFFLAQKAVEAYNGLLIRGNTLEVTYKTSSVGTTNNNSPPLPAVSVNQSPPPLYQGVPSFNWPQQPLINQTPALLANVVPFANQYMQPSLVPQMMQGPRGPYTASAYPHLSAMDILPPTPSNSPPTPIQGPLWVGAPVNRPYGNGRPFKRSRPTGERYHSPPEMHVHPEGAGNHIRGISGSSSNITLAGASRQSPTKRSGSFSETEEGFTFVQNSPITPTENLSCPTQTKSSSLTEGPTAQESRKGGRPSFEILNPLEIPETTQPTDPCNLFIKNLDDKVIANSEDLKNLMEVYGAVASAHLATISGSEISRGFGFVAFTKAEYAALAKSKVNGTVVGKKRVFVSYAERKEDRSKRLKELFKGAIGANGSTATETGGAIHLPENEPGWTVAPAKQNEEQKPSVDNLANERKDPKIHNIDPSEEKALDTSTQNSLTPSSPAADDSMDLSMIEAMQELELNSLENKSGTNISPSVSLPPTNCVDIISSTSEKAKLMPDENLGNEHLSSEKNSAIATTLASAKGWHGTQLSGIAEVEEEETQEVVAKLLSQHKAYVRPNGHRRTRSLSSPTSASTDSTDQKLHDKMSHSTKSLHKLNNPRHFESPGGVTSRSPSPQKLTATLSSSRSIANTGRSSSKIPVHTKIAGTSPQKASPTRGKQNDAQKGGSDNFTHKKPKKWNAGTQRSRGDMPNRKLRQGDVEHKATKEIEKSVTGPVGISVAAH